MALSDQYLISQDPTFQGRVKEALAGTCVAIVNEAITAATLLIHVRRAQLAANILNQLNASTASWVTVFAAAAATNTQVVADATQNSTVALTASNAAAQAALVTDTDLNNAISAVFNSFLQPV